MKLLPRGPVTFRFSEAPNSAWAVLPGWSGPPELLARIARAAVQAIESLERHAPECTISVTVPVTYEGRAGADVERFDSPDSLVETVTPDALRKFTSISICVIGENARADVEVTRERGLRLTRIVELFRAGRSAEGVRLTVASTDPDALGVDDARDAVLAAIARGHSRWRHAGISSGAKSPFKAEHETSSGEDPRAGLFLWAMFGCLFLITALNWLDLSPVHGTALQVGGAVLVGSLASAAAYLLMPVVEVSASTRVGQAGRAAIRIGLLIAGPAVGLLVKHLVEAYL